MSSSSEIVSPSTTALSRTTFFVTTHAAQTPTLTATAMIAVADMEIVGLAQQNGTGEVQEKRVFNWIGKLFKSITPRTTVCFQAN